MPHLKPGITYFLCPNIKCHLFWKPNCHVPCEHECPKKSKMKMVIVCDICGKNIVLPGDHCSWCRVDCECGASLFLRMPDKYGIIYSLQD